MDAKRRRRGGLAGVLGGLGLLTYVLLKELWIPTIGGMAEFDRMMGFSFHFFEVAPMVFLSLGLLGFYLSERDPGQDLADLGAGAAAAAVTAATVGHAFEHTMFYFGSPLGYAGTYTHYLGLGLAGVGLTVFGLRADLSRVVGGRERALLASTLPGAILLSAVLGTLLFRAYADGYKVYVAVVVAVVGYRLWRPRSDADTVEAPAVSDPST